MTSNLNVILTIGFLTNQENIFDNGFEDDIVKFLESYGASVIKFSLDDVSILVNKQGIEIFVNAEKVILDGFFSYGYLSKFRFEAYMHLINSIEKLNIPRVHSVDVERIINDRFLQILTLSKNNISFLETLLSFSIKPLKLMKSNDLVNFCSIKRINDFYKQNNYKCEHPGQILNLKSKLLWSGQHGLCQNIVRDEESKCFRALCINGKTVAVVEFKEKKSYNLVDKEIIMHTLMDHPWIRVVKSIAETTVKSIGNALIASVDITLSYKEGILIHEINGWPDLISISKVVGIDLVKLLVTEFYEMVSKFKANKGQKWNSFRLNIPEMFKKDPEFCENCKSVYGVQIGINNGVASFTNCKENCYKGEFIHFKSEDTSLNKNMICGMKWQCVEYSRRWLIYNKQVYLSNVSMAFTIFDMPHIENIVTEKLIEFKGYSNGSNDSPAFGDLLIFAKRDETPHGHVAVITNVNEELGYIEISEQNHDSGKWEDPNSYSTRLMLLSKDKFYYILNKSYQSDIKELDIELEKSKIIGWKRAII